MEVIPRSQGAHYHNTKSKGLGYSSPGRNSERNMNSDPQIRAGSKQKSSLKNKKKQLRANVGVGEKLSSLGLQVRLAQEEEAQRELLASAGNQMLTSCPTGFGIREDRLEPSLNLAMYERATVSGIESAGQPSQFQRFIRNENHEGQYQGFAEPQRETYPMFTSPSHRLPFTMIKTKSKECLMAGDNNQERKAAGIVSKKKTKPMSTKTQQGTQGNTKLEKILLQAEAGTTKAITNLDEYLLKTKLKTSHSHANKNDTEIPHFSSTQTRSSKKKVPKADSQKQKIFFCQDGQLQPGFGYTSFPGMFATQSSVSGAAMNNMKTPPLTNAKYQGLALSSSTKLPSHPGMIGASPGLGIPLTSTFSPRVQQPSKKPKKAKMMLRASHFPLTTENKATFSQNTHTAVASVSSKAPSSQHTIFSKAPTLLSSSKSKKKLSGNKSSRAAHKAEFDLISSNLVNLGKILLKNKTTTEGNELAGRLDKPFSMERVLTEAKLKSHRNHSGNQEQLVSSIATRNSPKRPNSTVKATLSNPNWLDSMASGLKTNTQTTFEGILGAAKTSAQFQKHHQYHASNQGISSTASGGVGGVWTHLADADAATATICSYAQDEGAFIGPTGFNSKSSGGMTFGVDKLNHAGRKSTEMAVSSSNVSHQQPVSESQLNLKKAPMKSSQAFVAENHGLHKANPNTRGAKVQINFKTIELAQSGEKKLWDVKEVQHKAAVLIQTAFRGWIERNRLQVLKKIDALKPRNDELRTLLKDSSHFAGTVKSAQGMPPSQRRMSHEPAVEKDAHNDANAAASLLNRRVIDHKLSVPERMSLKTSDKPPQGMLVSAISPLPNKDSLCEHDFNGIAMLSSNELSGSASLKEGFIPLYSNPHIVHRGNIASFQKHKASLRSPVQKPDAIEEYHLKSAESRLDPTINFKVPAKGASVKREGLKLDVLGVYPSSTVFQSSQVALPSPQSPGGPLNNFKKFAKEDYKNWQKVGAWVQVISTQLGDSVAGDVQQLIKQISQFAEKSKKTIKDQYLPNESGISCSENTKSIMIDGHMTNSASKGQPYCFERKVAIRGNSGNKGSLDLQFGSFQSANQVAPAHVANPSNSMIVNMKLLDDSLKEYGPRSGDQSPKTNGLNTQRSLSKRSGRAEIVEKWVEPAPNGFFAGNFSPQHSVASGALSGLLINTGNYADHAVGSQNHKIGASNTRVLPSSTNVFIEGAGHLSRGGLMMLQESLSRGTLSHKGSLISNSSPDLPIALTKHNVQIGKGTGVESSETRVIPEISDQRFNPDDPSVSPFKNISFDPKQEDWANNSRKYQPPRERNSAFSSIVPPLRFTSNGDDSQAELLPEDDAPPVRRPPDQDPDRIVFKDKIDAKLEELDLHHELEQGLKRKLDLLESDKEKRALKDEVESTDTKVQVQLSRPSKEYSTDPPANTAIALGQRTDKTHEQNVSVCTEKEGSSLISQSPLHIDNNYTYERPGEGRLPHLGTGEQSFEPVDHSLPISPIAGPQKFQGFPRDKRTIQERLAANSDSNSPSRETSGLAEQRDGSQRAQNSFSDKNVPTLERPSYRSVFSRGAGANDRDEQGNFKVTPYESVAGTSRPVSGGEQSFDQMLQDTSTEADKLKAAAATLLMERASYRSCNSVRDGSLPSGPVGNLQQEMSVGDADSAAIPAREGTQQSGTQLTPNHRRQLSNGLPDTNVGSRQVPAPGESPVDQIAESVSAANQPVNLNSAGPAESKPSASIHTIKVLSQNDVPEHQTEVSDSLTPLCNTDSLTSSPLNFTFAAHSLSAQRESAEGVAIGQTPTNLLVASAEPEIQIKVVNSSQWQQSEIQVLALPLIKSSTHSVDEYLTLLIKHLLEVCGSRLLNKLRMPPLPAPADIIRSMREYECYVTQNMEEFIYPLPRGFQPQAKHLLDDRILASFEEDLEAVSILEQNHPSVIIKPATSAVEQVSSMIAMPPLSREARQYQSHFYRSIFDAFNESLTTLWARESSQDFVDLATSPVASASPSLSSLSALLASAKQTVLQQSSLLCGLLEGPGTDPQDPLLRFVREERLSGLVKEEVVKGEAEWKNWTREMLVVLVDCADRVCEELVAETVTILAEIAEKRFCAELPN